MKSNRMLSAVLVLTLVAIAFLMAGPMKGKNSKTLNRNDFKATAGVLKQEWKAREIGRTRLSLLVPEGLSQIEVKLDSNALKTINSYEAYQYTAGSFSYKINCINAKFNLNSSDYAEKLAKLIQHMDGMDNYTYFITPVTVDWVNGDVMKGTGKMSGLDMEYYSAVLVQKGDLWEISIAFNHKNKGLRDQAEKILSSIKIIHPAIDRPDS